MPLLGPTGGGLGLAAWPSGGAVVVVGGAAPSSADLTTSLELLFLKGKDNMLLLPPEFVLLVTLCVSTNPEAADAMLQLAMLCALFSFSLSLPMQNQ